MSTQEVLAYPKPAHKVENEHARRSREPETRSKGGKRARKKFSRTRNPLQRGKTRTQEDLANPKPAPKVENEHARRSREPETSAKGGKRARKKFSRTRNPLKRWKMSTQEGLANPKPAPKGENEHARRSREPETHSKDGKRARKKISRTRSPLQRGKTRTQEDLANPKPTQKVENEHARSSREPETRTKGGKRARKKFSHVPKTRTKKGKCAPKKISMFFWEAFG
jgi:hypothetical protein